VPFAVQPPQQKKNGYCVAGYQDLLKDGNDCYLHVNKNLQGHDSATGIDWNDADFECQKMDGHLASIHSKEEHEAIMKELSGKDDVWIGLVASKPFCFPSVVLHTYYFPFCSFAVQH